MNLIRETSQLTTCGHDVPKKWREHDKHREAGLADSSEDVSVNRADITVIEREAGETPAGGINRVDAAPTCEAASPRGVCAHCGERCPESTPLHEGRQFCCVGCQMVFGLIHGSGMGRFYDLVPTPGLRIGDATPAQQQWVFLDEPSIQAKLLDYADDHQASVTFLVPAIHCVACVWLLENLYKIHNGIVSSRVNFARREVQIRFERSQTSLSAVAHLISSLGYPPHLTLSELGETRESQTPAWQKRQWLQLGVAGFGFGNVMLLALPGYLGLDSLSDAWFKPLSGWLGLALALPVVTYSAADYWRAAWISVRQRILTLDVPIAVGLAAIYGQSLYNVASKTGDSYCDSLAGLIFFLLCGRVFQRKTFDHLTFDLDYKGFFPLAVIRRTKTGEETVAISELSTGDHLMIRHGELLPADARLLNGDALVDYSFVTGESEPVARKTSELLYAGGRQVGGSIEVETVRPVSESYLISLWGNEAFRRDRDDTRDSQTNRYTARFTLLVMLIALAAVAYWIPRNPATALKAFTSVLIVACPCALALAAPLTLGSAHRRLATQKVYLRNAQILERMAEVDTVVLDKTGTLTTPGPGAVRWSGEPLTRAEQARLHSLSRHSAHPLASRVAQVLKAEDAPLEVRSFVETSGRGMGGLVESQQIRMGSRTWVTEAGEDVGVPALSLSQTTGSAVHVSIDGRYRGCFHIECPLRPEVAGLLQALRGRYSLVLLSGDHAHEAERFQALLGPDSEVRFQQTPFDKLEAIRCLQRAGRKVMMVGDGLNDAGALSQADVGVAVVERVGTFSPASDVIVDGAQLKTLSRVLWFSRRAARIVRAGFVVSGLYNVVGVSIAAAGLLSPLVCAVLMPLSSVSVVLFAIGTTRWCAHRTFAPVKPSSKESQP